MFIYKKNLETQNEKYNTVETQSSDHYITTRQISEDC